MTVRLLVLLAAIALAPPAQAQEARPLKLDDLFALRDVAQPNLSPDGKWVAYSVTTLDAKRDKSDSDVYMAPLAGGDALRLTTSKKDESEPRFSPDGKWLAFLTGREGKKTQVWLLPRQGGEAVKLTDYKASVSDLEWSPDGKRLALVVRDVDPDDPALEDADQGEEDDEKAKEDEPKTPKPLVIRRLQFKQDYTGYLRELRRHIHVFDVAAKTSVQVTSGPYDDGEPAWSPDGKWIAFSSNRTSEPDGNDNFDVFVVPSSAGGIPRALTTSPGHDDGPVFSPDGKSVAYLAGGDPKHIWYATNHVAVVPFAGGAPRALTQALDRNVMAPPRFTPDGRAILFLVEDGGNQHLARVPVAGGAPERVVAGERDIQAFDVGPRGELAFLESQPQRPFEVATLAAGAVKRLTSTNDAALKGIRLGRVERFETPSADGTVIHGFFTFPPDAAPGARLPAILRIHGGPTSQYSTAFDFQWQLLAAQGYLVIAPNPRGSTGYGLDFSRAIFAAWGNKDTQDVLAAVDHAVAKGLADPERLGVGGWSYGGMLTNYVITRSTRFKAAISGASISNYLAGYGTDHYQYWYEAELGLPWKTRQLWVDLSTPFFEVEKVTTPTLFMCGEKDMNVPLLNTEQMYQALRRVGKVETELVIYPDQWHGIETPSYQKDRYARYLAWYDKHLRPERAPADRKPEATSLLGTPLVPPEPAPEAKKKLEQNLAKASADFVKSPDDADAIIWLGRRLAYLGRYQEAIAVFSRGVEKHPNDLRLLRHRGHRYITTRQLDKAIADLTRAAELSAAVPDQVEPDGDPNPRGVPTGTSHFNVFYHLGLAHYLKGDFDKARAAYLECLKFSRNNHDSLTATSDWLYLTLMRLGRRDEAARLLEPIREEMEIVENHVYLNRLLMYKGLRSPEELLRAGGDAIAQATYGYAVGNWYLLNGQREKAKEQFERVLKTPQWAAFGYLAAEAELAREKGEARP
jgi:dipeptidyl aminopeptidase/acylaminoacyl peptidase